MNPVVRVATNHMPESKMDELTEMMRNAEDELKGILALKGLRSYFAGVDRARSELVNVSVWDSVEDAEQMTTFQPMLDLAARFATHGVTFVRPVPNFEFLWQWGDIGGTTDPQR